MRTSRKGVDFSTTKAHTERVKSKAGKQTIVRVRIEGKVVELVIPGPVVVLGKGDGK